MISGVPCLPMEQSEHSGTSCQHEDEEPGDCHYYEAVETVVSEEVEDKEGDDSDVFDEFFGAKLSKSQSTSTDSVSLLNSLVQQQTELAKAVELAKKPEVGNDPAPEEEIGDPVNVGHIRRDSDTDLKSEDHGKEEEVEAEQPLNLQEPVPCKESEPDMLTSETNDSKETLEAQCNDTQMSDTEDGIESGKPFCKRVPTSPEETWDFSLRPMFPNGKRTTTWVEGHLYRIMIEECFHEMVNVQCQCEERKKVSLCRLCHVVFCSNLCFKRTLKAVIGDSEDDEKKAIETGTESSRTKKPTVTDEITVSKCAQGQKIKQTVKKASSVQLGRKTNDVGNVTNEQGDHGRRQKQDFKPKKEQNMNSYPQQYAGILGFQPPLLPPQVQRNIASVQTRPPGPSQGQPWANHPSTNHLRAHGPSHGQGHPSFSNLNPPLQNAPPLPRYGKNSYPAVDSTHNILHPSAINAYREQFPQSMINGAAGLFPCPPPSMNQGPKSDINPNYAPHPQAMADSDAMKSTRSDSQPVGNLQGNSQGEQIEPVMLPKERGRGAPVKILRNPRPLERQPTTSNHYDQNDQKKSLNNSYNTNTPQLTNASQPFAENHQINQNHRHSSQDRPHYAHIAVEPSLPESTTYHTAQSEFTRSSKTSQNHKGHNPAVTQKSRKNVFGRYEEEELPSRNRNSEEGGLPRNRKYNSEESGRMNRNKHQQIQSHSRDSRESQHQQGGSGSFSTNPCEGNSLNYSASSGGRGINKWRQQASSCLMSAISQSSQASGSSSTFLSNNHSPKKSNKDKTPALYRILQEPDMPYGLRFPVKHVLGKTFSDFAVRTLKSVEVFEKFHSGLQDCRKEKMIGFEPDMTCLVQYRANEEGSALEWYRGIITKFVENVGVYLVDLGVVTLVPPTDVFELPEEFYTFSPCAIRFKCLSIKSESSNVDELLQYFDSLVCQMMIKIRVTHKDSYEPHKYAGHLEVLHIGKWFDVGVLLKKFQVAEMRTESDIATDEMEGKIKRLPGVQNDMPELSIHAAVPSNTDISVVLTHVLSLNEFYVTTDELKAKRTDIEKQLCSPGVTQNAKSVSCLHDLSYPLFMTIDRQTQRWIRVKVLEVSTDLKPLSAVVFKVDYGETLTVHLADLLQLPAAFHGLGCIYKCSLPVKPILKARKNTQDTHSESVRYLSTLCNSETPVPLDLRIFMMDNTNVHIVELFLKNTSSGCTFSFVKKGWVALAYNVELK
ncbi:unnamed protein product [Orchesella dallaii]|uniref:Tudor domain-containing protein n=1 Tax=Orchesella dallaii TaxID=48710 RepID=A0ABP1PKQ5_9HEXA